MRLKQISNNYFLKKRTPLPRTMELLRSLYPTIDWERVNFYEGLPWFTPMIAPYVTAQALPHFYSNGRFCIYLKKFDENRVQCLADVVHEAFHVLQGMHFANGYGFGFFRGWTFYYIAYFLKFGYRDNPFEIPAFDQEFRFLDHCSQQGLHGIKPEVESTSLSQVASQTALRFKEISFKYTGKIIFLVLSFFICMAITIGRPIADMIIGSIHLFFKKKPHTIKF